ncbi:type VI secretion system baseplate subunit TssG [Methylomicrobium album]|uniref:Type VI secretion protein, VC_A0111 family n=1 Tax=Methylomicrobium album BG8 TaxID=686340 RepID=H8GN66_METAL|nr:type VI secretion system baseplate subunit TssG [Methylomicrobium album]EIC30780.1 type VI secretion protein, VC_A0111 family [Methylomicrobium album BG8]
MAGENRTAAHFLSAELEEAAYRFDFFEAMRLIETWHPDKPKLGDSLKAADDPVRLGQVPELQFPASALAHYSRDAAPPRLAVHFFGLFGPNGPLPLHLTEYVRDRLRNHHDSTLSAFADVFHHRMLCLFYRAWADARPEVAYDRPSVDRFPFYVDTLLGLGGQAFRARDALPDRAKRFYAGRFAEQAKNPEGLRAVASDLLGVEVRVEEFVGEWMKIETEEHTRLGYSPQVATLGQSALLGAYVWGCQHKFRLTVGPLSLTQYLALLPGAEALAKLTAIVRNYVGDAFVWDINLILRCDQVPREVSLGRPKTERPDSMNGGAQLGWSVWLGPRPGFGDADDLMLNPFVKQSRL